MKDGPIPHQEVEHRTESWLLSTNLKQRNKPERTDEAYIEMIWKHFYPDRPYKTFRKNWNSSVAEYRVGKAQNLYNKGKSNDVMTMIYSYSYQDTHLSSSQVNKGTLEEESYHSS